MIFFPPEAPEGKVKSGWYLKVARFSAFHSVLCIAAAKSVAAGPTQETIAPRVGRVGFRNCISESFDCPERIKVILFLRGHLNPHGSNLHPHASCQTRWVREGINGYRKMDGVMVLLLY
jgi:hypothetical protein